MMNLFLHASPRSFESRRKVPRNAAFLKDLSQELKRSCGTGGAVTEDTVELQGDLRDLVRDVLVKKGFTVKG